MKKLLLSSLFLLAILFVGCQQKADEPIPIAKKIGVQREVFKVEKYPELAAVGRINFMGRKQCTLMLVSEDIAITAGHCFLEEFHLSDMTKDLDPQFTSVFFRINGIKPTKDLRVKRVLKAKMNPDYAIVRLNKKIDVRIIKPLKFKKIALDEMLLREESLGCAGFNGDKELGDGGFTMTISRNIEIISELSSNDRIDTNCVSTYGGSGGAFFEERQNVQTMKNENILLGVIWGVTDDSFNEKGELIKENNSITSITPVTVFYDELTEILEKDKSMGRN